MAYFSACYFGSKMAFDLLLEYGAQVNLRNSCQATPLHVACEEGRVELAKLLLASGADLGLVDIHNNTCLYLAAGQEDVNLVRLLVDHGADEEAKGEGRTRRTTE